MATRQRQRLPSKQQLAVLELLLGASAPHGYDIMKATGLGPGTLYGLLKRLHDEGYLSRQSEVVEGRNRICYQLSERGLRYAERALIEAEYEEALRAGARLETP